MKTQIAFSSKNQGLLRIALLGAALVSQVLTGCTNREVQLNHHDGPVVADEVVIAPSSGQADAESLKNVDIEKINTHARANAAAGPAVNSLEALKALEPFVLNRAYIEDPRLINTPKMRNALELFNKSLLTLIQSRAAESSVWLEKFRVAVESGCDGELKGCTTFDFFRLDSNSAKLIELTAQQVDRQMAEIKGTSADAIKQKDALVRLYYRRLHVSLSLKNRVADNESEFLYLVHASDYADAFSRSTVGTRERALLTQHSEVFENILNRFNPDLRNPEFRTRFETFVNAFSPWNYSRRVTSPFGRAATRMLSLAAKDFLYSTDGKLAPSLTEAIKKSQNDDVKNQPEEELDRTFGYTAKNLRETEPTIWKNLALSDSFARDEYFFIIDRVFGDHLTPDDASEIWRGSRRNSAALLTVAEQYIKIQMAAQIQRTNQYMSSIYSTKEWSSATLFEKAIEKSYRTSTQWNQLLARIERIQLFIDRNLKPADESLASTQFKEVNDMLISLRRNVKFLSVYPNMMLMAYFMAEVKFKLTVETFFGRQEIDSAAIINSFFDGRMPPLFNFGNDGDGLKRIETLYAFLFALKTDTFKAFAVSEDKKLDTPRFFEVVIGKFLDSERVELQDAIESVRKDMRQSTGLKTFMNFCAQDREVLKSGAKPGTKGMNLPIEFSALPYYVYVGSNNGYGNDAMQFHRKARVDTTKKIGDNLRSKLGFVDVMIRLNDKQMELSGASADLRKTMEDSIRTHLAEVLRLQSEYLTEVTSLNRKLSSCIDQAVTIEIDRQNELMAKEAQHLRGVWKAMKSAREAGNEQGISQVNEAIRSGLGLNDLNKAASNYSMLSKVTADAYVYAEFDIMLRIRQHLKQVAPTVSVIMPADLTDTIFWREKKVVVVPFGESEEAFVREGMKNFGSSNQVFVKWLSATSDPEVFSYRLKLLAALYKIGPMRLFDLENCQGKANMAECPVKIESVTAQDLVNETANVVRLLSLTKNGGAGKRDAEMLDLVGANRRWEKDKLKTFMLDSNADPVSLFEMTYQELTDDQGPLHEARDFFMTDRSVGHFLFSPDAPGKSDFKTILANGFKPLVSNFFDRAHAFEKAAREREQADAKSGNILEFGYEIRPSGIARTAIETERGAPVYLSRQKIDDFETRQTLFNREIGSGNRK